MRDHEEPTAELGLDRVVHKQAASPQRRPDNVPHNTCGSQRKVTHTDIRTYGHISVALTRTLKQYFRCFGNLRLQGIQRAGTFSDEGALSSEDV